MLSKVLTRLIDKAIIPALLLLASRIISIILVSKYLGVHFKITTSGFIFENSSDYTIINSYSILIMVFILLIGLLYVMSKSIFFHESHIKPSLTSRLFSLNAQSLIQNSYEIYTQGAVWISYSYLLLIIAGVMAVSNLMYIWVFYVILAITAIVTLFFVLDVEEEVRIKKSDDVEYDMDKSFVELPGELE